MKEFLRLDNRLVLNLKIIPTSPLSIKLGKGNDKDTDKKSETISLILTTENHGEDDVKIENGEIKQDKRSGELYIPGSTLKGLFRDKFVEINGGETEEVKNLFGFTGDKSLKGRIFLQDAYFKEESKRREFYNGEKDIKDFVKKRAITPLDHFSSKPVAPLHYEYTMESFSTDLIINNVNIKEWQNIYFILRDSINGEIRIGNSKTRGFGQVKFEINSLRFDSYLGKNQFFEPLKKYFVRNNNKSTKVGNTYLCEVFELEKKEYKDIDIENPNNFIVELFSEVK